MDKPTTIDHRARRFYGAGPLQLGELLQPDDPRVMGVHSTAWDEDARAITRFYDLKGARTGAQTYFVGDRPNPFWRWIKVVD